MTTEIQTILAERSNTHGDFTQNSIVSQSLKEHVRTGPNWDKLLPHQREALEMIAHKIGRILAGNPNHADHWDDIAGYAKLVSNHL